MNEHVLHSLHAYSQPGEIVELDACSFDRDGWPILTIPSGKSGASFSIAGRFYLYLKRSNGSVSHAMINADGVTVRPDGGEGCEPHMVPVGDA